MFMSTIQEEIEANLAGAAAIATDLASSLFVNGRAHPRPA
jgi:hypothetical protein